MTEDITDITKGKKNMKETKKKIDPNMNKHDNKIIVNVKDDNDKLKHNLTLGASHYGVQKSNQQ